MKILFVSYSYWPPDFGGELLASIERFQSLVQRGHQVIVLTSGKPGLHRHEVSLGIEINRSPMIHTSRLGKLIRLITFVTWVTMKLLTMPVDVVHYGSIPGLGDTSKSVVGLWLAFVLQCKDVPTVVVHSLAASEQDSFLLNGLSGKLKRFFIQSTSVVVNVSPKLHADAKVQFPDTKQILLPYAVRDDIFVPLSAEERSRLRQDICLAPDTIVFAFMGSVGRRKGFDILAQAFADLSPKYPTWRLLVIGPRSRIESQNISEVEVGEVTNKLNSNPHVVFVGRVDDRKHLATLLGASDVFVFSSRREGMPIAPMEAMSVGLPPIIVRIEGITDQVNIHDQTGLYISTNSVDELKDAMIRLGTNANLRRKFGAAARQRIEDTFSWEKHIDKWEQLYLGA